VKKKSLSSDAANRLLSIVTGQQLNDGERANMRSAVFHHVLRNSAHISNVNFSSLSSEDLGTVFHAIDEHYFDGLVGSVCENVSVKPLAFRLSTRMTSSGGMTTRHKTRGRDPDVEFEIAVATTPLFGTFKIDSSAKVGGLICNNRLEALQRIMEHEMIHLIEMLLWDRSSCATNPFREIVRRFFGHLESNHQLLTPRDIARKKLGISIGASVEFDFEGKRLTGTVNRISKRATILVTSPNGTRYTDGKHYHKYYVPLNRLRLQDR